MKVMQAVSRWGGECRLVVWTGFERAKFDSETERLLVGPPSRDRQLSARESASRLV